MPGTQVRRYPWSPSPRGAICRPRRVRTRRPVPGGVPVNGSARALDVAQDDPNGDGVWRAYVATAVDAETGNLSVVTVDPDYDGGTADPLWGVEETPFFSFAGQPLDIEVAKHGGAVQAYITSMVCKTYPLGGPLGPLRPLGNPPICIECSGGAKYRHLYLHVVDVTDPEAMSLTTHALSIGHSGCSASPDDLASMGLAFGSGGKLFVANPDQGTVEVVYTDPGNLAPGCMLDVPCDVIDAGAYPVDVAIAMTGFGERLYVANRWDLAGQRIEVFDATSFNREGYVEDVMIEAIVAGKPADSGPSNPAPPRFSSHARFLAYVEARRPARPPPLEAHRSDPKGAFRRVLRSFVDYRDGSVARFLAFGADPHTLRFEDVAFVVRSTSGTRDKLDALTEKLSLDAFTNKKGQSLLSYAAGVGSPEWVRVLLEQGCDPNRAVVLSEPIGLSEDVVGV